MKHVFIINPTAGKKDSKEEILALLKEQGNQDCLVHVTTGPHDATDYTRQLCLSQPQQQFRFYACGGDGTMNEVLNGLYGLDNAALSVYPCGSGNDFVKYFGGAARFLDIGRLLNGVEQAVDVMKINGRCALNVISFGFDTRVVETMIRIKRKPLIGGRNAYFTGVFRALFGGLHNKGRIAADGAVLEDREYLLCSVANGDYVGGSFRCAPRARTDDGLMEVCLFSRVPLLTLLRLMGQYTKGLHLDDPRCQKYMVYRQAKTVELDFPQRQGISVDGELLYDTHFTITIEPKAVRFAVPAAV
jgi:diacylglycerol kinase (ATP)